jgi:acetyltransferase-like isoleucine patch superfamily enzyme
MALRDIGCIGQSVVVGKGVKFNHPECVSIGNDVQINDFCWVSTAKEITESGRPTLKLEPRLSIGDGTYIGRFCTIACINKVTIDCNVLISDKVYIGDAMHGFLRTDIPIKAQYLWSPGPIRIKDGAWIGINAAILPNVTIGRNSVVGANSVVTKDVPDFCIVAGNPARILKKIDPEQSQ